MEAEKLKGYLAQGLSLNKIRKIEGKSLSTVRHWMRVHGLKPNFKNFGDEPFNKSSEIVDGKKFCVRCGEWKELTGNFSPKGKEKTQHYCRPCLYAYQLERWKKRKRKAVEMMGGKCSRCGYCRNYSALEFHHLDPSKKEQELASSIRCSWSKFVEELKKCVLVCSNCHREEHHQADAIVKHEQSLIELNKIMNLELKSTGKCPTCGTEVFGTKYCSHACSCESRRKAKRPGREELENLIKTTPILQIGKIYGVSDNAIRKWAEFYGIEFKKP